MAEYIERESAIKSLLNDSPGQVGYSREDAADCIFYMDAADVAPVRRGHWNTINQIITGLPWKYRCSDCGCPQEYTHNYCPNCGAKMA